MSGTHRSRSIWPWFALYFVALCVLVAGSAPRRVGDGYQYMAMALNLAHGHGPSLSKDDLDRTAERFGEMGAGFAGTPLVKPELTNRQGRQEFPHFWLYPLLAAPAVRVADWFRLSPNYGFTALNITLLLAAFAVAVKRLHPAFVLLLFVSPIVWWTDKAHTEVFTFSLLIVAFSLANERLMVSLLALAVASTQNPPFALLIPVIAWCHRSRLALTRRWIVTGAAVSALALVHPLYYLWRLGRATLLIDRSELFVPGLTGLTAVLIDPNIGLFWAFPAWPVVVLGLLYFRLIKRRPMTTGLLCSLLVAAVVIVSVSQAPNVNHGGTPGLSRHGLWLIPVAVPLMLEAGLEARQGWWPALVIVASISAVWSSVAFRPSVQENYQTPTRAASWLWSRWPALDDPLPEIFAERAVGLGDAHYLPASTPHCEKVLLVALGERAMRWPLPCPPVEVPAFCQVPNTLCYANRFDAGYQFAFAPRQAGFRVAELGLAWNWNTRTMSRAHQRQPAVEWDSLRRDSLETSGVVIESVEPPIALETFRTTDQRFVRVPPHAGASHITIRVPSELTLAIIDGRSFSTLTSVTPRVTTPGVYNIDVPSGTDAVLMLEPTQPKRS